jgi:hypothetical protein
MCCFNIPYVMLLSICIFDPFEDPLDVTVCYNIFRYIIYLLILPICIITDIITFPFHVLNVFRRIWFGIDYSPWYFYDTILRSKPVPEIDSRFPRAYSFVECQVYP